MLFRSFCSTFADNMKEFVISEAKAETAVLVGLITKEQDEARTNEYLDELAGGRFWISRIEGRSIRAEDDSVIVHISLKSDTEIPFFGQTLTSRWFSDDVTCVVDCKDIGLRTRIYSAVMETGMEIKGLSTVLTKLSELVNRLK